jgi:hypothetical protein
MPNKKISNLNLEITLKDNTSYEKKKRKKENHMPNVKTSQETKNKKEFPLIS